jgi:DHA2 family multidrug resistance protein
MSTETSISDLNPRHLIAFFAMVVGMFMAILDIQIVASSLSVIAAGLSASGDEISWIQTAYIIAEVIIIPVTGFTSRLLSTRVSFSIASIGFTVMSVLCSMAWNIESMIIFRAFQGFFGGAMIPTAFGAVFIIFPKHLHSKVTIFIGLIVTVAPTLGPTLGGYITENISWHFMFLINVIPGIFVSVVMLLYADFDKPNYSLLNNFDFVGISTMTFVLGALQYILEEGTKKSWFEDTTICILSVLVVSGFIFLIFWELAHKNPIIDLSAFKDTNFSFGCIYSFVLGVGLYGSVYLLPLFLFSIAGFNSYQIGITMIVTGIFQFISAPLAGKMFDSGIDKRIILGLGFLLFSLGTYLNSFLTVDSNYNEFFLPQMVRGLALMFCFMPINDLAFGTMARDQIQNASGLYNLTRNLGGAMGIAVITSIITRKTAIYGQVLKDNIPSTISKDTYSFFSLSDMLPYSKEYNDLLTLNILDLQIKKQVFVIAINDVFVIISMMFCFATLLLPFSSKGSGSTNSSAH